MCYKNQLNGKKLLKGMMSYKRSFYPRDLRQKQSASKRKVDEISFPMGLLVPGTVSGMFAWVFYSILSAAL